MQELTKTFSLRSLGRIDMIKLVNALYFDPTTFEGKSANAETEGLTCVAFIMGAFIRLEPGGFPYSEAAMLAVKHHGARTVARRLISLAKRNDSTDDMLGYHHPTLLEAYCTLEEIRSSLVAQKGHVALIKKGWDVLKASTPRRKFTIRDFGPRRCFMVILRWDSEPIAGTPLIH